MRPKPASALMSERRPAPTRRATGRRVFGLAALLALAGPRHAEAQHPAPAGVAPWIAEAAARFALPPGWIAGVMGRESGFQAAAVSPAGAMGLMQVMPATYAGLRLRYGLGADPLAPRDNILAGAAYLRELYDRFGERGFLAAYNAGPGRYMQSLLGVQGLPLETRRYVSTLSRDLGLAGAAAPPAPRVPSLFVSLAPAVTTTPSPQAMAGGLFAPVGGAALEGDHGG